MPQFPIPRFLRSEADVAEGRTGELFSTSLRAQQRVTNRLFFGLFILQWIAGVLLALWRSPFTWEGGQPSVHFHVWVAAVFGAVVAGFPLFLISRYPDAVVTRHATAVAQMLVGALLIHISGGRIETHFHVFGSLAFLAFYRDPWVLATATAVVLTDHLGRGIIAPLSIYGTSDIGLWRTAEHAFWIGFEDVFLWIACAQSRRQLLGLAQQQTELEQINERIELAVETRTKELTAARDAAVESTRLKSQFMANVSHEIRTPMNGILGTTELLLLSDLSEEQLESATTVHRSAESLLTLINEILDFSKIEAGRLQVVTQALDLPELVEGAFVSLAHLAEAKGLRATCTIHGEVPEWVNGDATRLRQILNNLIGNAVKFTERGEIDVRLSVVAGHEAETRIRFEVADTGIGIPAELAPQLFEAFVQGDGSSTRRHEGTGLGLAIALELAKLMGGEMGFTGRETGGTVFWFEVPVEVVSMGQDGGALRGMRAQVIDQSGQDLGVAGTLRRWGVTPIDSSDADSGSVPVVVAPGARSAAAADPAAHFVTKIRWRKQLYETLLALLAPATGEPNSPLSHTEEWNARVPGPEHSVLVAEDNPINQRLLVRMLEKLGHRATVTVDGMDAVEAVRTGQYDLVLMDWQMPRMDGLAATKTIRGIPGPVGRIPVIAVTANAMAGDRERCTAAGMDGFLVKPIRLAELAAMMAKVCGELSAAERTVGSVAAGTGSGVSVEAGPRIEGFGENIEQGVERGEIVVLDGSGEGGLDPMVARDVDGVDGIHQNGAGGGSAEARAPAGSPNVVGFRVREERANERIVAAGCGREPTECEGIVDRLPVHGGQEAVGKIEVVRLEVAEQSELGAHAGEPGGIVPVPECFEDGNGLRDRGLLIGVDQGQQRLSEPGEIPTGDLRLLAVGIAAAAIDGAEDGGGAVGIEKGTGAVVDRLAGDGHVVGVHYAVDEADVHPTGDQRGLPVRDGGE